ncbi:alpha/beta fold hydrolase [Sungkyunkwania multivorans]|uniref:Alpha/beta fold hydrolase n=1 Tax=Sungkyunkwania multivorans TaxID=1173618 RepID=A0ABW3D3T2_9FLAO
MLLYSNIIGEGSPLLILHGFLGMSDNWKTLGRKFAEEDFEVHLIDQRNHGRSFHHVDFNYELLVEDLKYYIDHHQLLKVNLLGHSMGGKTAMLFAATYPDRVDKLLVADIAPKFYPTHHQQILAGLSALHLADLNSRKLADELLSNYVSELGIRQFLLKNLYWKEKERLGLRVNIEALKEHVHEVGESLPIGSVFEGDTLFLRGDRSEYIIASDETGIRQHFPNAVIQTIENAGHWLHAENPIAFSAHVLQFLNR